MPGLPPASRGSSSAASRSSRAIGRRRPGISGSFSKPPARTAHEPPAGRRSRRRTASRAQSSLCHLMRAARSALHVRLGLRARHGRSRGHHGDRGRPGARRTARAARAARQIATLSLTVAPGRVVPRTEGAVRHRRRDRSRLPRFVPAAKSGGAAARRARAPTARDRAHRRCVRGPRRRLDRMRCARPGRGRRSSRSRIVRITRRPLSPSRRQRVRRGRRRRSGRRGVRGGARGSTQDEVLLLSDTSDAGVNAQGRHRRRGPRATSGVAPADAPNVRPRSPSGGSDSPRAKWCSPTNRPSLP